MTNITTKVRNGYSVTADISPEYILSGKDGDYHLELRDKSISQAKSLSQEQRRIQDSAFEEVGNLFTFHPHNPSGTIFLSKL